MVKSSDIHIIPEGYDNQDWVKSGLKGKSTPWQVLDKFHSVWVSASAGSGKTYLLTARVLNLLLSGVEPEKVLCITYTNAGASEMKARVNEILEEWSRISDDDLMKDLRERIYSDEEKFSDEFIREKFPVARSLFFKILQMSSGMKIQTIHSFCQVVLKRFPVEAGISSNFQIIDERDVAELLEKAYKKVFVALSRGGSYYVKEGDGVDVYLDGVIAELSDVFSVISENTSYSSFEGLREAVVSNRQEFKKFFDYCEDVAERDDAEVLSVVKFELERVFLNGIEAGSKEELWKSFFNSNPFENVLKDFVNTVEEVGKTNAGSYATKNAEAIKKYWNACELFSEGVYDLKDKKSAVKEYAYAFLKKDLDVKSKSYLLKKDLDMEFPHFYDFLSKEGERVQALMKGLSAFDDMEYTYAVSCFAYEFIRVFQQEKSFKGGMDFDDMLDLVNKLFSNPSFAGWVLYKLDGGIDHLLVDESQDTSPFQWDIINSLTEEFFGEGKGEFDAKSVFVVGDKKQSIYSFQGADIFHFNMFREKLKARVVNRYDASKWRDVSKNVSFRTTPPVLEIVNSVLSNSEGKTGVVFEEDLIEDDGSVNSKLSNHISVNSDKAGEVVLFPVIEKAAREKSDNKNILEQEWEMPYEVVDKDSDLKKAAVQVASEVHKMISDKVWLDSKERPVEASDFMVLVKKRNDFSNLLIRELLSRNVEVAGADQIYLGNYIAFDDLLGLLEFLIVKEDDLLLSSVLKSPIFGFDEEDIFKLVYGRKGVNVFDRLKGFVLDDSGVGILPDADEKFVNAFNILKKCEAMFSDGMPPYDFYSFILGELKSDVKFYERLGGEFEDFSDEFLNLCLAYESSSYQHLGLSGFFDWVKKSNNSVKRDLSSGASSGVRIMTCHGSKGLEAPVVIIPCVFSDKSAGNRVNIYFAGANEGADIFSHSAYRIPVLKHPFSFANESVVFADLKEAKKLKETEEGNRLLYVAMTRAREKLLVFGLDGNEWYKKIGSAMDAYGVENKGEDFDIVAKESGGVKKIISKGVAERQKLEVEFIADDFVDGNSVEASNDSFSVDRQDFEFENLVSDESEVDDDIAKIAVSESGDSMAGLLDEDFVKEGSVAMERGTVVHKMMEFVEQFKPLNEEKIRKIFDEYLSDYPELFSDELREKFVDNSLSLYGDERFAMLFENDWSRSEVEFMYDGGLVRIDKLVRKGNSIFILDFKTDEFAPDDYDAVSYKYKVQLRTYKRLVADVYPDCKIYSALLYLTDCSLVFV